MSGASSESGSALSTRGIMRSRRMPPCAKRPMELNATPTSGRPFRRTSLISATRETVWSAKLTTELVTFP